MSETRPHVSLVIPAYNEEGRIAVALEQAEAYFSKQDYAFEIIVVDDGSTDATADIVRDSYPTVRLISYPRNRGKGYAMR